MSELLCKQGSKKKKKMNFIVYMHNIITVVISFLCTAYRSVRCDRVFVVLLLITFEFDDADNIHTLHRHTLHR